MVCSLWRFKFNIFGKIYTRNSLLSKMRKGIGVCEEVPFTRGRARSSRVPLCSVCFSSLWRPLPSLRRCFPPAPRRRRARGLEEAEFGRPRAPRGARWGRSGAARGRMRRRGRWTPRWPRWSVSPAQPLTAPTKAAGRRASRAPEVLRGVAPSCPQPPPRPAPSPLRQLELDGLPRPRLLRLRLGRRRRRRLGARPHLHARVLPRLREPRRARPPAAAAAAPLSVSPHSAPAAAASAPASAPASPPPPPPPPSSLGPRLRLGEGRLEESPRAGRAPPLRRRRARGPSPAPPHGHRRHLEAQGHRHRHVAAQRHDGRHEVVEA